MKDKSGRNKYPLLVSASIYPFFCLGSLQASDPSQIHLLTAVIALTLLVCWRQSLLWKSLQPYNLQTMSNGFLQFNSPLLLCVSTVPVLPRVRPVPPEGEVLDLSAAASLVPWRGTAGRGQSP